MCLQCRRPEFNPWVGKTPWRRAWQPTPVFLPRESSWTEEPGRLQSMGLQRVRHQWATKHSISARGQCCSCYMNQVQSQVHKPFQSEQLFSQEKTPSLGNMFRDVYRHFKISVSEPCNLTLFFLKAQFTYFFLLINFYWSVVSLQCCISFRHTAKWVTFTYTYIHSSSDFLPI